MKKFKVNIGMTNVSKKKWILFKNEKVEELLNRKGKNKLTCVVYVYWRRSLSEVLFFLFEFFLLSITSNPLQIS